jgi:hypothetical protein
MAIVSHNHISQKVRLDHNAIDAQETRSWIYCLACRLVTLPTPNPFRVHYYLNHLPETLMHKPYQLTVQASFLLTTNWSPVTQHFIFYREKYHLF